MSQRISRILSILLVFVLCGIIASAFGYQFFTDQKPCPLCFLQRAAMIGIAGGQLMNFRFGIKMSHHAISLFNCVFGGAVSLRQISLHICPGFPVFGTRVLGFELYTWAFIAFVCSIIVIAVLMHLYSPSWEPLQSQRFRFFEQLSMMVLSLIILADIIAVASICGIYPCPDNP